MHHGLLGGHVDVLTEAAARPLGQREQRAVGGLGTRVQPRLGNGRANRCAIIVARERERAAGGDDRQIGRGPVGLRSVTAERRDRHVHEGRVHGGQLVAVEGGAAFDEHVGTSHEIEQLFVRVAHDARLASAVRPPLQAVAAPARRVALRRLDEDDLRTEGSEYEPGHVTAMIGQIQYSVRREHR